MLCSVSTLFPWHGRLGEITENCPCRDISRSVLSDPLKVLLQMYDTDLWDACGMMMDLCGGLVGPRSTWT